LTDYILTVSVSTAAGTAALTSAFAPLTPYSLFISIGFVVLIAFGNLKGVKESGKIFAVPTYFFIVIMGLLLLIGAIKAFSGGLNPIPVNGSAGIINFNQDALGTGIFYGATLYVVLHAFASGGAAVTGVEAISNGVTAFKRPEWKNARVTLVIMGVTLGTLFFGLSALATKVHPVPYTEGSPTVISQIGDAVFGGGPIGHVLYYMLQAGTMLILVLAANTSFADFPRLASFHAGDNFMPKQLTKRGHRLVFSNGIIALAVAATVMLLVTNAKVDRLIPLYAIGVFTSFTMSQAGMAKHHLTRKEPGWRKGLFVNATGAVLSLIVDVIILITKFTHGAWVIVVVVPAMVAALVRLNRAYEAEAEELTHDAPAAAETRILAGHVVFILIDELDQAAARAIQYARTLTPDELRAIHFDLDPIRTDNLASAWRRLGLTRIPLDIIECPDRRIARAAAELAAQEIATGDTEVTLLLPRRQYTHFWHRFLHDRTADTISAALAPLPHCNVTIVPFQLGRNATLITPPSPPPLAPVTPTAEDGAPTVRPPTPDADSRLPADRTPINACMHRQRVRIAGRIHSLRVQSLGGSPALELSIADDTGTMTVVFIGRRQVGGLRPGVGLVVEGTVGAYRGAVAILNPVYEILPDVAPTR
jgi:amino acid transporter